MPAYTALRVDLYTPCKRGDFFPSGFPSDEASLCSEMSRLAYCRAFPECGFDRAGMEAALQRVGFTNTSYFETAGTPHGRGTHAFLTHSTERNLAVLAFRGTDADDPSDITDDLKFLLEPWPLGGRVHRGFVDALSDIKDGIDAALVGLGARLLVTGHSLGAALATVMVSSLFPSLGSQVELYTFGSPRVGDEAFTATVPVAQNHRFVHCCDAITRIPLPIMGYAHIGDPHYIDFDGKITLNPGDDFVHADRRKASQYYLLHYFGRSGTVQARELADHTALNYVSGVSGTR